MTVSPVETAKAIDMPFREWTRVGRRNYIRWVYVSPTRRGTFEGDDDRIFLHAAEHHFQWL